MYAWILDITKLLSGVELFFKVFFNIFEKTQSLYIK